MTRLDVFLFVLFAGGILLMLFGLISTNISTQEMREALNDKRSPANQLKWQDAIQKVAQKVIDEYRDAYPDGPLSRSLQNGYYIFGIGLALVFVSGIALKFL